MSSNKNRYSNRRFVIAGIAICIVLIYVCRLFYLQVWQNTYKEYADSNAFFRKVLYPARGVISDRTGKLLVHNEPTYDIVFIPREVKSIDTLGFCKVLGITKEDFDQRMSDIRNPQLNPGYSRYTLQTFLSQLSAQEYGQIQEHLYKYPGFSIQNRTRREYSYPNAGNILGYVSEVGPERIAEDPYYRRGDYEGKAGVERSYEHILRGEKGVQVLLRDVHGRIQGSHNNGLDDKMPISGKNITLSIDIELQAYGEYLMQNKLGSIVMIEPSTGEILCLVSAPSYNPSLMSGRALRENYRKLATNPQKPLFNRPILGVYPPGSTFKTTQGLIFLQEGIISKNTNYPCHMGYPPLRGRPACHPHPSPLPLAPAIATSCNSFFCYGLQAMLSNRNKYQSTEAALEVWKKYLVNMGLGYRLGIDLPSEKRGFIPNSMFYTKAFGSNRWGASSIISVAIGQGEITTTPLQIANMAAGIANKGFFYTPHVVREIANTAIDASFRTKRYSGISPEHYDVIIQGMAQAVTGGTCRGINLLPEIEVCGKTGTAENPHGKDHSIFMGFAPRNNPQVAIAVFVENAGFGATYAVPIARLMLQKYLKGDIPEHEKYLEERMARAVLIPGVRSYERPTIAPQPVADSVSVINASAIANSGVDSLLQVDNN